MRASKKNEIIGYRSTKPYKMRRGDADINLARIQSILIQQLLRAECLPRAVHERRDGLSQPIHFIWFQHGLRRRVGCSLLI